MFYSLVRSVLGQIQLWIVSLLNQERNSLNSWMTLELNQVKGYTKQRETAAVI